MSVCLVLGTHAFGVHRLGLRVEGLVLRVSGLGFKMESLWDLGLFLSVWGLGFWTQGFVRRVQGLGFIAARTTTAPRPLQHLLNSTSSPHYFYCHCDRIHSVMATVGPLWRGQSAFLCSASVAGCSWGLKYTNNVLFGVNSSSRGPSLGFGTPANVSGFEAAG